jgi:PAS domain S-box-containing protein
MVATPERRTLRKPLRVLLVEDSENDALLLLRELRRAGYEVDHERVHTTEGMRKALLSSWAVIISDYRMPRFSAMEALKMANASGSDAPFIVVSGRIGEDVAVEAMRGGAYDYVMKGNLSRLPQTVERGLEKAQERRQRRRIEEELQRRDAILEAVRFAADQFLGEAAGWEESIKTVLRRLGEATEASRVYVFENITGDDGERWATQRYEWVAAGISAQIDNPVLKGIPYKAAGFGRWVETLGRGDLVYGHVRDFPESEQHELRSEDVLSIALVPIFVEGRWWGFIGFDECVTEREWSAAEVGALGAAAGTLGAAIRRRRTEEQLRGSEERYRAVIEQATDGIYLLDAGTRRFVETNPSFQRMLGYTATEIQGLDIYDIVAHPREDVDATIDRTLKSGRRIVGERKYRRKDGAMLDVEVGVSVISLDGRDVICTIVRDVTERKQNEEALRASEAELRAVFGAMDDVILVLNGHGRYLKVAPTTFSHLYRPPEELVGKSVHDTFPKEQADKILGGIRRALGTRERVDIEYGLEVGGTEMWFAATITPMTEDLVVTVARDITERKRNEEALSENEERFKGLAEATFEGIAITHNGRITETNAAFARMFGYEPHEVIGLTPLEVTHPASHEAVRGARASEREEPYEAVLLRKDGSTFDAEIRGKMSLYRGENVRVTAIRDITERKRAEEALTRSEGRLRQIIETEPECVKVLGANGSLLEMNPAGLAMIEADSLEQVRGRSVYRYIAPGHRDAFVALTEKVLRGGSGTLEFELIGLKGTRRWLDTHAVPLRDARGGTSGLLAITRDITERKRAEAALKESERLYRTVMEQATENIFFIDVESGRIVESNATFREALGYSEDKLHSMTLYDIVADDRAGVDANIRRVLEQGSPSVGERRYIRKDGTLLDVEVSASVILRDGKKTLVAVAHDITERVRAQHLLEERVATLSGIAEELTLDRPTENVLGDLARSVVNASTAVACGVVLIGEQEGAVNLFGSYGLPEGYTAGLSEAYRAGVKSPSLEAYRSRRPVLVRDLRAFILDDPLYEPIHHFVREAPWDIVYSLPLISRGLTLGAIFFCFLPEAEPGEDEKVFLRAVADQAAVAVENARLFSETRGKAALEERQKLARELHDSVSQALYGIALGVETARELLPYDPERAAEPLNYATTLAEAGMTEMRALIFELRPESLEKEGLVAALEKQTAAVQARHGIKVEATFDNEPDAALEIKESLYRIAQEALHNAVKHARASNAKVRLKQDPDVITLEISDDGAGFDAQDDFPGHLGLKSMRERASRLGGTLEVVSEPGEGVRILARVPR